MFGVLGVLFTSVPALNWPSLSLVAVQWSQLERGSYPSPFLRQITVGVCYLLSPIRQPTDSCWNSDPTTFVQTSLTMVFPEQDLVSNFDIAFACSTTEMSLHQFTPHCRLVRLIQSFVSALPLFLILGLPTIGAPWQPPSKFIPQYDTKVLQ